MKSKFRSVLARQELEQMLNRGTGKVAAEVRGDVLSMNNTSKMDIITYLNPYNHENGRVWVRAYVM